MDHFGLDFQVFYYLAIKKHTIENQTDILSRLFKNAGYAPLDTEASLVINGHKKIPYAVRMQVVQLGIENSIAIFGELRLSNIVETVNCFNRMIQLGILSDGIHSKQELFDFIFTESSEKEQLARLFYLSISSDYSQPALSKEEKVKLDYYYEIFGKFLTRHDEMEEKLLQFYYQNNSQFPLLLCAAYACLEKKTGQTAQLKPSRTPQDVKNVLKIMNTQTSTDSSKGNTPLLVTAKEILKVAVKFDVYPYSLYSENDPNDLESFCMDLNLIVLNSNNLFVNIKGKYAFICKSPQPSAPSHHVMY